MEIDGYDEDCSVLLGITEDSGPRDGSNWEKGWNRGQALIQCRSNVVENCIARKHAIHIHVVWDTE